MGFISLFCLFVFVIIFFADFEYESILFLNLFWVLLIDFVLIFCLCFLLWFFICFEFVLFYLFILIICFCISYYKIRTSFFLIIFSLLGSLFFLLFI